MRTTPTNRGFTGRRGAPSIALLTGLFTLTLLSGAGQPEPTTRHSGPKSTSHAEQHPLATYLANPGAYDLEKYDGLPPQVLVAVAQYLLEDPRYVQLQLASINIMDHAFSVYEDNPAAVVAYLDSQPTTLEEVAAYPPAMAAAHGDLAQVKQLKTAIIADNPEYETYPWEVHQFALLISPTLYSRVDEMLASHASTAQYLNPEEDAETRATRRYNMLYALMINDLVDADFTNMFGLPDGVDPDVLPLPPLPPPPADWIDRMIADIQLALIDLTLGNIDRGIAIMAGGGPFFEGYLLFALGVAATVALPAIAVAVAAGAFVYGILRLAFEPVIQRIRQCFDNWLSGNEGFHCGRGCINGLVCDDDHWCKRGFLGIGQNSCEPKRGRGERCTKRKQCEDGLRCRVRWGFPPRRECR